MYNDWLFCARSPVIYISNLELFRWSRVCYVFKELRWGHRIFRHNSEWSFDFVIMRQYVACCKVKFCAPIKHNPFQVTVNFPDFISCDIIYRNIIIWFIVNSYLSLINGKCLPLNVFTENNNHSMFNLWLKSCFG